MALRTLNHLISMLALRYEIIFSLDQLLANALTQDSAAAFEGLRDEWSAVFAEELALRDGLSACNARVVASDAALNSLASRVSKAILTLTGDDRTHPLYVAFFKRKTLGEFKRPVLGAQLEATRAWLPLLKSSDVPSLSVFEAEVESAVAAADEAVAGRDSGEAQMTSFREVGNRKKFIDQVNVIRKTTYAELATMPHESFGLPIGFADMFFRHESGVGGDDESPPTAESLKGDIASFEKQIVEKKDQLAKLEAAAKEREKATKLAAIAELQKKAEEAAKQVAEAQAKIAELSM